MKTSCVVAISLIAGAAIGAAAIQGVNAQAKKVYFISESEVIDQGSLPAYEAEVQKAIKAFGGDLVISGKVISVLGDAPKRVGITEYSSAEKARAWVDSPERKALAPSRDKAIKFTRQYIVEGK